MSVRMVCFRIPVVVDREIEVLAAKSGLFKKDLVELGLRMVIAVGRLGRVPPELERVLDEKARDTVAKFVVNLASYERKASAAPSQPALGGGKEKAS